MNEIIARLEASLYLPELPESARINARELYENLARPVTIAILGAPGAGKTALMNLLLRERVIPEGLSANLIEIVPGSEFESEVSYSDGRLEACDSDELQGVRDADRVFIASPNPILNEMVLIEASGSGSTDEIEELMVEVTGRADIVLWCTNEFDEGEQAQWNNVNEQLRHHSFLILTKADKLARKRKLAEALGALSPTADKEFAGLLPIATLQALKALDVEPMDEDLWAGSGADGLLGRISEHARIGRQADFDQAELFLARYAFASEENADSDDDASGKAKASNQKRRRSRMTRDVVTAMRNEAEAAALAAQAAELAAEQAPKQQTHDPDQAPEEASEHLDLTKDNESARASENNLPPKERRVVSKGLADRLGAIRKTTSKQIAVQTNLAETSLHEISKAAVALSRLQEEPSKVLNLCSDTAETLNELYEEASLPANLADLRDEVLQTREHMTLLHLENTAGSAADAVSILLQLKRDFEAHQAA